MCLEPYRPLVNEGQLIGFHTADAGDVGTATDEAGQSVKTGDDWEVERWAQFYQDLIETENLLQNDHSN